MTSRTSPTVSFRRSSKLQGPETDRIDSVSGIKHFVSGFGGTPRVSGFDPPNSYKALCGGLDTPPAGANPPRCAQFGRLGYRASGTIDRRWYKGLRGGLRRPEHCSGTHVAGSRWVRASRYGTAQFRDGKRAWCAKCVLLGFLGLIDCVAQP